MSGVATTGIGYALAYPWAGLEYDRDFWRITVDAFPPGASQLFSPPGPTILVEGYGRVCYEISRGGEVYYCPWIPITVSPMIVPIPDVRNGSNVQLVEFLNSGVSWTIDVVRVL